MPIKRTFLLPARVHRSNSIYYLDRERVKVFIFTLNSCDFYFKKKRKVKLPCVSYPQ